MSNFEKQSLVISDRTAEASEGGIIDQQNSRLKSIQESVAPSCVESVEKIVPTSAQGVSRKRSRWDMSPPGYCRAFEDSVRDSLELKIKQSSLNDRPASKGDQSLRQVNPSNQGQASIIINKDSRESKKAKNLFILNNESSGIEYSQNHDKSVLPIPINWSSNVNVEVKCCGQNCQNNLSQPDVYKPPKREPSLHGIETKTKFTPRMKEDKKRKDTREIKVEKREIKAEKREDRFGERRGNSVRLVAGLMRVGDVYDDIVKCQVCHYKSSSREKAMTHMKMAHEKKLCFVCLNGIPIKGYDHHQHFLEKHTNASSKGDEKAPCPVCGVKYSYNGIYHHISREHLIPFEERHQLRRNRKKNVCKKEPKERTPYFYHRNDRYHRN